MPEVLERAAQLETEGDYLRAIDLLQDQDGQEQDPEVERRLVALRHHGFDQLKAAARSRPLPDAVEPPGYEYGVATTDAANFTPAVLRGGIESTGSLLVRDLIPARAVDRLVSAIDRARAARDASVAGAPLDETLPWYEPFRPIDRYRKGGNVIAKRNSLRGGGVWVVDSPRAFALTISIFREAGLTGVIEGFLGERPAISMSKSTLRLVGLGNDDAAWHQDGAFLGKPIRTINAWVALTDCGVDAPGLDIVPRRLDGIVDTGTEGAAFPWSVAQTVAERSSGDVPIARPAFRAGDVLLFDEIMLHRTACDDHMTRDRYAIEMWHFAPSIYPDKQIPFVI